MGPVHTNTKFDTARNFTHCIWQPDSGANQRWRVTDVTSASTARTG